MLAGMGSCCWGRRVDKSEVRMVPDLREGSRSGVVWV
jgi:hypothetical protein